MRSSEEGRPERMKARMPMSGPKMLARSLSSAGGP